MSVERLLDLLLYTKLMNTRFIEKLVELNFPGDSKRLMEHVLNAQHIWRSRIEGLAFTRGPWAAINEENLIAINVEEIESLIKALYRIPLGTPIQYSNTRGEEFSNSLDQIVAHVANHGTHHRAQISYLLRKENIEPIPSDYILYKREKSIN